MTSGAQDDKKATIKEVMQVAMKGGLCKKVAKGEASAEEKKKLAGLFAALHENKPPKGEQASWDEKTKALVDAANDVLAGKEGAGRPAEGRCQLHGVPFGSQGQVKSHGVAEAVLPLG